MEVSEIVGTDPKSPNLQLSRWDGTKFSRIEMEMQLREKITHMCRLIAFSRGLPRKQAYDLKPIFVLHWLLDQMVKENVIEGQILGVQLDTESNQQLLQEFTQRLVVAIQTGEAVMPKEGDGINMSDIEKQNIPTFQPPPPPVLTNTPPGPTQPSVSNVPPPPPQTRRGRPSKATEPTPEWVVPPAFSGPSAPPVQAPIPIQASPFKDTSEQLLELVGELRNVIYDVKERLQRLEAKVQDQRDQLNDILYLQKLQDIAIAVQFRHFWTMPTKTGLGPSTSQHLSIEGNLKEFQFTLPSK